MTPNDLITLTLKAAGVVGVGQTASAEDVNDCFTMLNAMLGQWQKQRWLIYHLQDVSKVSTGAANYTIGDGGDFNVQRPGRIEAAFVRFISAPMQPDFPLEILQAREDWNDILVKSLGSVPCYVFYDAAYPMGVVNIWPVPTSGLYEVHLSVAAPLNAFSALTDTINLPPEYTEALIWNLAGRIRPLYQLPPDQTVSAMARATLQTIRADNAQIGRLSMPSEIMQKPRGSWAVFGQPAIVFGNSGGLATLDPATLAELPTTLPATPGVLWNNGGVLCVS